MLVELPTQTASFQIAILPNIRTLHNTYSTALNTISEQTSKASIQDVNIQLDDKLDISINEPIKSVTLQTKEQNVNVARLLILLAACLYGTNYTCIKVLSDNIPTEIGSSLRFLVASFATLPWLFQSSQQLQNDESQDSSTVSNIDLGVYLAGAELGFYNSIGYIGQALGLQTTPASTCAFLCSLTVVVVPLFNILAGKKIYAHEINGALLALAGVAFLEFDGLKADFLAGNSISIGLLFCLLQPMAFGLGFWRLEHLARKYPDNGMQITAAHMSSVAVLMFLNMINSYGLPSIEEMTSWISTPIVLGATLWTGIVTTVMPTFFETKALRVLSASETTVLYSTEPIFGTLFAILALGETLSYTGVAGAALILGGCLYSSLGEHSGYD